MLKTSVGADYITDEQFDKYIDLISDAHTTRQCALILGKDRVNIYKWLVLHASEEQHNRYARALEASADSFFEDGIEAALSDTMDVQRARLRYDALTKAAAKRRPKMYGDRQTSVLEGGDKAIESKVSGSVDISGQIGEHIERILNK